MIFEAERAHLTRQLDAIGLPETTVETVVAYIMTGRPAGHFVQAVMNNDLRDAVARADLPNQLHLVDLVKFLVNHAPAGCFGWQGAYDAWRERRGLSGEPTGPFHTVATITVTEQDRIEARRQLVYEKALKFTRMVARTGYSVMRDAPEHYIDQARVIEREAQAAWSGVKPSGS